MAAVATPSSRTPERVRPQSRWLHPLAWWSWAAGLAVAASTTTNPLLLIGLMLSAAVVVEMRKPIAPWAKSFGFFIKLALAVVVIRVIAQILIGAPGGTITVVSMPGATLPAWLAGVRLGGDVMLEPLLGALYDGLRLATILVAIGAASALASPSRLLKSVPAAVYEIGVSVVVATTFLPQLVSDVARVRANRRLRGRRDSGVRGVGAAAMPVLHGAMDRSITLAAAMDSRGYGRSGYRSSTERTTSAGILLAGLLFSTVGAYGLLGTGAATWWGPGSIAVGVAFIVVSLIVAGKRSIRTRYRPNAWQTSDLATAFIGGIVAVLFVIANRFSPFVLAPSVSPPAWPSVSLLTVAAVVIAMIPAIITPPPPRGAGQGVPIKVSAGKVTA